MKREEVRMRSALEIWGDQSYYSFLIFVSLGVFLEAVRSIKHNTVKAISPLK